MGLPELNVRAPAQSTLPLEAALVHDADYLPRALELIDGATERVYMIAFVIYDSGPVSELLDRLIAAHERGVEVKVLADEESEHTSVALTRLASAGVQAKLDSPKTTTHNKLLIGDDEVLVGSHNLSENALTSNTESSMKASDGALADYYARYFQALWVDSSQEPGLSWQSQGALRPILNREIASRLMRCIENAQERVRLVLYAMTYNEDYPDSEAIRLVDALVAARRRGLEVDVILDGSAWMREQGINDRAHEILRQGDVRVRRSPGGEVTHAKALTCDDILVVGDANWSYSSFSLYNGTSLQVTSADLVAVFDGWFETIWRRSVDTEGQGAAP